MNTISRNEIFHQMTDLLTQAIATSSNGYAAPARSNWQSHLDQTFLDLKEKLGWSWADRDELSKAHSDALDDLEKEMVRNLESCI